MDAVHSGDPGARRAKPVLPLRRELIALLDFTDFDLGGFSLGARTTVEGVGEGLRPRRAILGGAGLEGLRHWERRKTFFLEAGQNKRINRIPHPRLVADFRNRRTLRRNKSPVRFPLRALIDPLPDQFDLGGGE